VKIQYALPLAVAIGLGFGAATLHARTTPPVYVVVEIDEVTDANGFEALRQTADAIRDSYRHSRSYLGSIHRACRPR